MFEEVWHQEVLCWLLSNKQRNLSNRNLFNIHTIRDRLHISLLIIREFKQINKLLKIIRKPMDFWWFQEERKIVNSLNIKSEIWRRSITEDANESGVIELEKVKKSDNNFYWSKFIYFDTLVGHWIFDLKFY